MARIDETLAKSSTALDRTAALNPFFEDLSRLERRELERVVRVLHYGDSHAARESIHRPPAHIIPVALRRWGPGFVHAGHPWKDFRGVDVTHAAARRWRGEGLPGLKGDGRNEFLELASAWITPANSSGCGLIAHGGKFFISSRLEAELSTCAGTES